MKHLLSIGLLCTAILTIFLPTPYIFLRPYILLLITLVLTIQTRPTVSRKQLLLLACATFGLITGWVTGSSAVFEPTSGLFVLWCYSLWVLFFMNPTIVRHKGYTYIFAGILLFVTLACIRPAVAETHYIIGMRAKTIGKRIASLTQATTLMPSNARYHRELSSIHLQAALALATTQHETNGADISNHITTAINESQLMVRAEPKNARSWATLGITYLRVIGPVPDAQLWAQASFERAIKLDSQNPTYPLLLAQTYIQSSKSAQAQRLLRELVTQFPHDARAPYLYASLLEQEDPSQARNFYQIALSRADKEDAAHIQKRLDTLGSQEK